MRDQHSSTSIFSRSSVRVSSLLLATGLAATLTITACSSGSSSSGVGVSFTRTWSGVMRSNATNQTFPLRIQLVQSGLDDANGIQTSTLGGTAIVGENTGDCHVGGIVTGTTTGSSVVMNFGGNTFSGAVRNNGLMEGLWSSDGTGSSTDGTSTDGTSTDGTSTDGTSSDDTSADASATFAACASFDSGDFSLQ